MLNLHPIFTDPIDLIKNGHKGLETPGLPAVIYFLQVDVINHYKHAIDHYFDISLDESYLQNSSIGSPYQKWMKFSNDNWDLLSFTCYNLIRYTSRLYHEIAFRNQFRDKPLKVEFDSRESNLYTSLLSHRKYNDQRFGLNILDNESIEIYTIDLMFTIESSTKLISIDIHDRSEIGNISRDASAEVEELVRLNDLYKKACEKKLKLKLHSHTTLFGDYMI